MKLLDITEIGMLRVGYISWREAYSISYNANHLRNWILCLCQGGPSNPLDCEQFNFSSGTRCTYWPNIGFQLTLVIVERALM